MNDTLKKISTRLHAQDNRCASNPMFCVQVKRRIVGMDADYSEETVWVDMESGDAEEVEPGTPGAEEFGVREHWETVMVAFTEEGCNEYLRLDGHNLRGETRIYVMSFNRCPEMIALREHLLSLTKTEDGISERL